MLGQTLHEQPDHNYLLPGGPVKIQSTHRASFPAHLCRHKLLPLELCAVQSPGVNVPALSPRAITFQGFIQTTSMRFQRFLCMFQSVQACQTSKCCGGTCKWHHLAASVSQTRGRLQAKGESRPQWNEGDINPAICRGGTFKNHSK